MKRLTVLLVAPLVTVALVHGLNVWAHDSCTETDPSLRYNSVIPGCELIPDPPPTGDACPQQPAQRGLVGPGGPYPECGSQDSIRIPSPANLSYHISHVMPAWGGSACIMETTNWSLVQAPYEHELPDVVVTTNHDVIYRNRGQVPGRVIFDGRGGQSAQRIQWINVMGGSALGYECRNGARNVEVDGVCICP